MLGEVLRNPSFAAARFFGVSLCLSVVQYVALLPTVQ